MTGDKYIILSMTCKANTYTCKRRLFVIIFCEGWFLYFAYLDWVRYINYVTVFEILFWRTASSIMKTWSLIRCGRVVLKSILANPYYCAFTLINNHLLLSIYTCINFIDIYITLKWSYLQATQSWRCKQILL